jgi:hypothetical protein
MSSVDIQAMLNSGVRSAMRFSDLDGPHTKTIIYDHDEFITEIKTMESSENKPPVYTQEMADAGELPPVGVECLVREGVISDVSHSCVIIAHDGSMAVFKADDNYPHSCYDGCAANMFHPLPAKTHEELAVDNAMIDICADTDDMTYVRHTILRMLKAGYRKQIQKSKCVSLMQEVIVNRGHSDLDALDIAGDLHMALQGNNNG